VPSPLSAAISGNALVGIRGISEIGENVVLVSPAERISHCPILGMAVKSDSNMKLQAHRVVLVVTGTVKSKLNPIHKQPDSASACFFVESREVKCELSPEGGQVHLRGYCSFDDMLEYRLDTESSVVLVSSVDEDENGAKTLTVESMQKVGKHELADVVQSMTVEWKAALTEGEFVLPDVEMQCGPEYWCTSRRGVKRVLSEAVPPMKLKRGPG
jgi:hypothetical protein